MSLCYKVGHLYTTVLILFKIITLKATSNGNDCMTFKKLQGKQIFHLDLLTFSV